MNTAAATKSSEVCSTATLGQLAIDPMNVRRTDVEPTADFVANILAEGVQVPMLCRPQPGSKTRLLVFDGGKRIRALLKLQAQGVLIAGVPVDKDYPLSVVVQDLDDKEARARSLTLAIHRQDIHPIDKYEAFADLIEGGETVDSVAVIHGMPVKSVRQALALGALSDKVRGAWRAGEINAKTAQAFTLAKSHKAQDRVFGKLKKSGAVVDHLVHRELNVADEEIGVLVTFVGVDTLVAAGCTVTPDLFNPAIAIVSDPDQVKQLADDKLAQECTRLVADDGWAWALPKPPNFFGVRDNVKPDFTPNEAERMASIEKELEAISAAGEHGEYDYDKEEALEAERDEIKHRAELRNTEAKFRKRHGCMIFVGERGTLQIDYGYKDPPKPKQMAGASASGGQPVLHGAAADAVDRARSGQQKKKSSGAAVSNALNQRLSEQLTNAAAQVMRRSPGVAYAALVAGALGDSKTVSIAVNGMNDRKRGHGAKVSFVNTFETMMDANETKTETAICELVARALDFEEFHADTPPMKRKETAAIVNALDGREMLAAIAKAWDAADYFANVSGSVRKVAVTEALGEVPAAVASMKKDPQVKWCAANVPPTGWLPPQLRTAHYKGPAKSKAAAAVKTAPAKPRAAKKKPAKKRGR